MMRIPTPEPTVTSTTTTTEGSRPAPLITTRFDPRRGHTEVMQRISLEALARQQLELSAAHGGRPAADTVVGGHERVLRQTVIGMITGAELGEHNNPGEATIYVLRGRVRLVSEGQAWEARSGDLLKIPDARHSLMALEDSAILLTVAKLP